jgi:signal transduction histidine kinase
MDDPALPTGVAWVFVTLLRRLTMWRARAGGPGWVALDILAAAGLTAGALAVLGSLHYSAPTPLVALVATVCTTTVAWRRWSPAAAALVSLVAMLVYQRLSHDNEGLVEPFAIVLCFYTLGRTEIARGRRAPLAVLLGCALVVAVLLDVGQPGLSVVGVLLGWVPVAVLPVAAGFGVERHRALNVRLADAAARLREEQAARAAQAQVLERNRVARELHDVVAHSVSVMVIQAGAARLLAPGDAGGARDALAVVVSSGHEALTELRRVMGVLRRDDQTPTSPHPMSQHPGVAALGRLIEPVRATGLDADLVVEGQPFPLPSEVDLVAYRVVQEALTNAARHAEPGPATVRLRYQAGAIDLEISNTGQTRTSLVSGSGHGLIGMAERVQGCDGQFEAGPRLDGGFRVWARIPVAPSDATAEIASPREPAPGPEPLRRARAWVSQSFDPLFAVVSLVALETAAVSYGDRHGWLWLNALAMAVIAGAALVRRRLPFLYLVLVGAGALASRGLADSSQATLTGTYVLLVPAYSVGAWLSRRRAMAGLVLWLAVMTCATAVHGTLSPGVAAGGLMAVLAWAAGCLIRRERELAQRLQLTTSRLQEEREQRAQLAVAEERARLARQLQHQVAQLVVAMVVQAQAAARILADSSSDAVDAISATEATGRDALDQMRHILGVLRSGDEAGTRIPVRLPREPEGALR